MRIPYLVSYDITDEKRLVRLCSYMKERGIHLQYSVFYCVLDWEDLKMLKQEIREMINEKEDDVRIYPLTEDSLVASLGKRAGTPEDVEFFF